MDKVLSQPSSFLRVWPIPSNNFSGQPVNVGGLDWFTVHYEYLNLDLKKCYNPSQSLFWRGKNSMLDQTTGQKFINFVLLTKKRCATLHYMCTPWTHHCTGQAGHGKGRFTYKKVESSFSAFRGFLFLFYSYNTVVSTCSIEFETQALRPNWDD